MKTINFVAVIGLLISVFAVSAAATDIYQWRDRAGIVHFTDDPMQVPADQRLAAVREVVPLPAQHGADTGGKAAWDAKCASCHSPTESIGDKRGLGQVAWPSDALRPISVEVLTGRLRDALSGKFYSMEDIEADDDELGIIARYLITAQK